MLLFNSCTDEKLAPTREEFLTNSATKQWKLTRVVVNGNIRVSAACDLDNIYRFNANSEYSENEGSTTCDATAIGSDKFNGYWFFSKNKDSLRILNNNRVTEDQYKIDNILKNKLEVSFKSNVVGDDSTYYLTYEPF